MPAIADPAPAITVTCDRSMTSPNVMLSVRYDLIDITNAHVVVEIVDPITGEVIYDVDCGMKSSGTYYTDWQGRDYANNIVPDNAYTIRAIAYGNGYCFDSAWGTEGTGDGQFSNNAPFAVAADGSGSVYATDYVHSRVEKFSPTGAYLLQFGGEGTGNGQFAHNGPTHITTGPDGSIYVVDPSNQLWAPGDTYARYQDRVEKFSADGTYLTQFFPYGRGNYDLWGIDGLATDADGYVYASFWGYVYPEHNGGIAINDYYIQKYDEDGEFVTQWSITTPVGISANIGGIAVDSHKNVYIADFNNYRILKFDNGGHLQESWGTHGWAEGQFQYSSFIAVDSHDNVFVADPNMHRIQVFDNNGNFLTRFGGYGSGNGLFRGPYRLSVDDDDNVYVADMLASRVQKFTLSNSGASFTEELSSAECTVTLDSVPPVLLSVSPVDGATNVGTDNTITATFSEPVDPASVDSYHFTVVDTYSTEVAGTWSAAGNDAIFTPDHQLDSDSYTIVLQYLADYAGNYMDNMYIWSFSTETPSMSVTATSPFDPAHATSTIHYVVSGVGVAHVLVEIVDDDAGQVIRTFDQAWRNRGWYDVLWDGKDNLGQVVSPGTYTVRVKAISQATPHYDSSWSAPATMLGIANDSSGNVYVVEETAHHVIKYNGTTGASSILLGQVGAGDGNDEMNYPEGIAVDGNGNIYVSDTGNNRIKKFDPSGNWLATWGVGVLNSPKGLAFDASGILYVADAGNNRIQKFNAAGTPAGTIGIYGSGNGQLDRPCAITVDADGNAYVADAGNNRIEEFDSTGSYVSVWASGSQQGQFNDPRGMAFDPYGNWYVADMINDRIQLHNQILSAWSTFGCAGSSAGQFSTPAGLAIDPSGNLYVADKGNSRIQKFATNLLASGTCTVTVTAASGFYVVGTDPDNGDTGVATSGSITATFSQQPDADTIYSGTFTVRDHQGNPIGGDVTCDGNTATFTPSYDLSDDIYTVTLSTSIRGTSGDSLASDYTWWFVVGDLKPLSVIWSSPSPGSADVWKVTDIVAEFSILLDPATITTSTFTLTGPEGTIGCSVSYYYDAWHYRTVARLVPSVPLVNGHTYTATLTTGIRDITGRSLDHDISWSFTVTPLSAIPPAIIAVTPAADARGITPPATVSVTFGEDIRDTTVTAGTFRLLDGSGNPVGGTVSLTGRTAIFTPDHPLPADTRYTVKLAGIEGMNDNPLQDYEWIFDTSPASPAAISVTATDFDSLAGSATITYQLTGTGHVFIDILNSTTRAIVRSIDDGMKSDGTHAVAWDGMNGTGKAVKANTYTVIARVVSANGYQYQLSFSSPHYGLVDAATDAAGNVYVLNEQTSEILKYDSLGHFQMKWGANGSRSGQFFIPESIAVTPDGTVYIADRENGRIQVFDREGNFLRQWGAEKVTDGRFHPMGVSVGGDGNVYVADPGYNRIEKFDASGNFLGMWGSAGTGTGQFIWDGPTCLAVYNDLYVFANDHQTNRVQKFDTDGNFLRQWGSEGSGNGQFDDAWDIAYDSVGRIYVTDYAGRVEVFSLDGDYLAQFGSHGTGVGQISYPLGIALNGEDAIYVVDCGGSKVVKYSGGKVLTATCPVAFSSSLLPNASYVSDTLPGTLIKGQTYDVDVTFHNNGSTNWNFSKSDDLLLTWTTGTFIILGSNAGTAMYGSPHDDVLPGQDYTWHISLIPNATGSQQITFQVNQLGIPAMLLGVQIIKTVTVTLPPDSTPPVTTFTYSGTQGTNEWNTSNVFVFLDAVDAVSDVSFIAYQLDGTPWAIVDGDHLSFVIADNGIHLLRFNSTDSRGNREADKTVTIKIDKAKPTTTCTLMNDSRYDHGLNGWNTSDVTVDLLASDPLPPAIPSSPEYQAESSHPGYFIYQVDGGQWIKVNANHWQIPLTTSGIHTINYNSIDYAGNAEANRTVTVKIDKEAPTFVFDLSGTLVNGEWYTSVVTATVDAADTGGSGLPGIAYHLDTAPWSLATGTHLTYDIGSSGTHTFWFNVSDNAGNRYSDQYANFKIDRTAPETMASFTGTAGSHGWYRSAVTVTLSAGDAGSGVATRYYQVDSLGWNVYNPLSKPVIGAGEHTISYYSVDNVGNTETTHTTAVKVDTTLPTVVSTSPPDEAVDVSLSTMISVRFSEEIDPATFSGTVRDSHGNLVAGIPSYAENVITFDPSSSLARETVYTMTIDSVKDVAGNPLSGTISWSFRTIPRAPVTSFTANRTSGNNPLAVQFTDTTTLAPTAWSWDFGDSSIPTAQNSRQDPQHTYTIPGIYQVTLTASNSGGSSSFQQQITVYPRNDSQILSFLGPSEMITGKACFVNVSVRNTGETTWKPFFANIEGNIICNAMANTMAWYVDGKWIEPYDGYFNSLFAWTLTSSRAQVAPGETVWYNYTFTPHDPYTLYPPVGVSGLSWGQHNLTFRMLGVEGAGPSNSYYAGVYFGENRSVTFNVRGPVDNAQVISVNCPDTMFLELENTVTVVLKNTGDTTWDYRDQGPYGSPSTPGYIYDLKIDAGTPYISDGPDDLMPCISFTKTRSSNVVQPGGQVTYTFKITPHSNTFVPSGHYTLDCRMLGYRQMEDMWPLDYFGQTATLDFTARKQIDNATILSVIAPTEMVTGKKCNVNISARNTGESTWQPFVANIEGNLLCDAMVNSMAWYVDGKWVEPDDGYFQSLFAWTVTASRAQVAPGETVWYNYTFTPHDPYTLYPPTSTSGLSWGQHNLTFKMLGVTEAGVHPWYSGVYFGENRSVTFNVRGPVDNALVVSVDCPGTLFLEQGNIVTVVLRNTGDTTWDYRDQPYGTPSTPGYVYDLKIDAGSPYVSDGPDDLTPFLSFTKARSKNVVQPGEEVTYSFNITPHVYLGVGARSYSLDCRMLGYRSLGDTDVLDYFGGTAFLNFTARKQTDNATILSINAPSEMLTGKKCNVNISVRNTGESTWQPFFANIEEGMICNAVVNSMAWYVDGVFIQPNDGYFQSLFEWTVTPSRSQVAPGEIVWYNYTFTPHEPYTLYPPIYSSGLSWGQHTLTFRMLGVQEAGQNPWYTGVYFGENRSATFNVRAPVDNASIVSVNYPDTMYLGRESTVTIRLRNTGDTTWKYTPVRLYFSNNAPWDDIYDLECGIPAQSAPPTEPDGLAIVKSRSKDTVAPGEEVIYTLKMTPGVVRQYSIDCRMLGVALYTDGAMYLKYFGDKATLNISAVALNDIRVTAISPSNGASGVSRATTVTATFDRDMNSDSVKACFKVFDNLNNSVAGAVVYSGRTATFTPSQPLTNGEHYTAQLNGVTDDNGGTLSTYSWGFRVVYAIPSGNPGGPTLIPTATPAPFQATIGGVSVNVNGDHITGPVGSDISRILTNGHVTIPAGGGTLTADITVGSPKNTGTITGVHVADSSPGTLSSGPATVSVTADLDGLPSGSVTFSATISDPPSERTRGYGEWLSGRGREIAGTPLAEIDIQKGGFTNAAIVGGTAKITLTVKKPAGFSRTKTYTVIRHGDDGYEELTATYKSETEDTVTFEILSPNGFSTFLLAETATAPTPVPTLTPPPSATPVPGPAFLLIGLAVVAGAMIGMRMRKKRNGP
ncbi:MAG TPA: Ig-like domain-containing protein [Methanocella sp.]